MERDLTHNERMDVAYRVFRAMRAQYPDRLITLVDAQGRTLARSDWCYQDEIAIRRPATSSQSAPMRGRRSRPDYCPGGRSNDAASRCGRNCYRLAEWSPGQVSPTLARLQANRIWLH